VAGGDHLGNARPKKDDSEICSPDSLPRFPDQIGGEWGRGTKPGRLRCSGGPRSGCVPPSRCPPLERERGASHTNLKERAMSGRWVLGVPSGWGLVDAGSLGFPDQARPGCLPGNGNWELGVRCGEEAAAGGPGASRFFLSYFSFPFPVRFVFFYTAPRATRYCDLAPKRKQPGACTISAATGNNHHNHLHCGCNLDPSAFPHYTPYIQTAYRTVQHTTVNSKKMTTD